MRKLRAMADAEGTSVNALLVRVLERLTSTEERRRRLERYATWTEDEATAFDTALANQRVVDKADWQ